MQYLYTITRPADTPPFKAEVVNPFGHSVFNIEGPEIFASGTMADPEDIAGLEKHLKHIKILNDTDTLKSHEEAINQVSGSIFSNPTHRKRLQARMDKGGLTDADTQAETIATEQSDATGEYDYTKDPEYQRLETEYQELLTEMKALDKRSYRVRTLSSRIEAIQRAKKRLALGTSLLVAPRTQDKLPAKKMSITAKLGKGGKVSPEDIESLLDSYQPPFKVLDRSNMDTDGNVHAEEKYYWVELTVEPATFKQLDTKRKQWLLHFQEYIKSKGLSFIDEDITTIATPKRDNVIVYRVTDWEPKDPFYDDWKDDGEDNDLGNGQQTTFGEKPTATKIEGLLEEYEPPFAVEETSSVDTDSNRGAGEKYYFIYFGVEPELYAQFNEKYKQWLAHFKQYIASKGYSLDDDEIDITTVDGKNEFSYTITVYK